MNGPMHEFLSAPLWLLTTLHVITLTCHLAAMNFMVGGVIAILFGKFDDRWANPVVRKYIKLLPTAMAATVSLGVAPLLFVQLVYGELIYSASIVSGWFWFGIMIVAMISYYLLYAASFAKIPKRDGTYLGLALLGFIYISYVYSSVFAMAERPDLIASTYAATQSGWALNPDVGGYIVRWLHMITGAITVGAFFFGWIGRDNEQAYKTAKNFFLYGMIVAMVMGLGYLFMLGDALLPLMRSPGIWWMLVSVILSLGSLHFFMKKKFNPAAAMLMVSLLGMVVLRHYVRLANLGDSFDPSAPTLIPQWGVFFIFVFCLLLAVAVVWYMVRLFLKENK